jgi:ubiquitin-like 1-activating enzyme E1 A
VDAAKARIEALNPLVTVQALRHPTILEQDSLEALIMSVDLVCVTDWDREALVSSIISSVFVSSFTPLDQDQ